MKSFVTDYFDQFQNALKPCNFTPIFKQRLLNDISKLQSLKDAYLLHEFIRQNQNSFDFGEIVELQLHLNQRVCLLEYIKKHLPDNYYSFYQVREMLQKTQSVLVCKAIKLHIEIHLNNYLKSHSQTGLIVFDKLIQNRITSITQQYHV